MEQANYPEFTKHKAEHDELTRKVLAFQSDYDAGRIAMSVELLHFLKHWLTHHISESDHAYAPFLKANTVA